MIKSIRHTGIVATDLNASLHFYRDLLGFKITKKMEESGGFIDTILSLPNVAVTTVKMAAPDGSLVELLKYHSHPRKMNAREICDIGITHIALEVNDLDDLYEMLKGEGIVFTAPPQVSPDGYAKVTFCSAPEGTSIELVEVL